MNRAMAHRAIDGDKEFAECLHVRALTMEQWCALARDGFAPAVTVPLEGTSMLPLIRKGIDPVVIAPVQRDLKVGDVVLFVDERQRYVVHRVWKLEQNLVQTLGDNCHYPEPWFPRERVLGMAVSYKRGRRNHRLDTRGSRAWGRMWMALYPARRLAMSIAAVVLGWIDGLRRKEGEGARDER